VQLSRPSATRSAIALVVSAISYVDANGSLRTTDFARPASSDLGLLAEPEHGSVSTAAGLLLAGGAEATNGADEAGADFETVR
jgi:hypothetical protein